MPAKKTPRNRQCRPCGDCTACCWALKFLVDGTPAELRASAYDYVTEEGELCTWCESNGCSLGEERPESCAMFFCLWSLGMTCGGLTVGELRPDYCGAIVSKEGDVYEKHYVLTEAYAHAFDALECDDSVLSQFVRALRRFHRIVLRSPGKQDVWLSPEHKS